MKSTSSFLFLSIITSFQLYSQVLSTPGASVSDNGTNDNVIVNGYTKLVNPNGRTLIIERDNENSWLTFHTPNYYWFSMGIDWSNNGAFTINSGGVLGQYNHFVMRANGYAGLGTANPGARLHIVSSTNSSGDNTMKFEAPMIGNIASHIHHGLTGNWYIRSAHNTGNVVIQDYSGSKVGIGTDAPLAKLHISNGDVLLQNTSTGYPAMYFKDITGSNSLRFDYNSIIHGGGHLYIRSGESNHLLLNDAASGNVGIGTSNPNEKLTVNGTIYGKEVKVDLAVPGPDYVFEKDYDLRSLEEIKSYIDQHKHLPEVPSASEMEANGINVGDMNMLLLKKIEELTLYLIELKEENEEIKKQLKNK